MFQVTITGGKGGTGKSFVAVNLAVLLARSRDVVLADLDLEAPNDHILLGIDKLENEEPIKAFLPFIDTKKCTMCGVCAKICDTGAILMPPRGYPVIFPRLCSGCKACLYGCPYKAIIPGYHVLGYSYVTPIRIGDSGFTLVTGILREGEEHTPPAVVATKRRALSLARDILIVDTGAGTGNQISIAIHGSNLVIAVTEPTPLGLHDLEPILKITYSMNYRTIVVINKFGIGDYSRHLDVMRKYSVEEYFTIPYHRDAVESYVRGIPVVVHRPESIVSKSIFSLYEFVSDNIKKLNRG